MLAVCFFSTVVLFSAFLQVSGQSMELDNLSTDSLRIGIRLPVVGIDGNSAAICRTFRFVLLQQVRQPSSASSNGRNGNALRDLQELQTS